MLAWDFFLDEVDMTFSQVLAPDFWKSLNPTLHVNDQAFVSAVRAFDVDPRTREVFHQQLVEEGYFQFFVPPKQWQISLDAMAQAVRSLLPLQLVPTFAFVYDEFWLAYAAQARILSTFLGENYWMLPDFWVWHVDPQKGESGWGPHRDKGRMALYPEGTPKSLTVWIPLTNAIPMNGCMYIVPANRDQTYNTENEDVWKFDYPDIRALPARPGHVLYWNQAVVHWGSRTSRFIDEPRISVAFEFQRADVEPFNQPLLNPRQLPSFDARLKLIAKQILQYTHMYPLSPELERFARGLLAG